MTKWEYLILRQDRGFSGGLSGNKPTPWEPSIDLDDLGQNGWELVAIVPIASFAGDMWAGTTSDVRWIFKRPCS